MIRAALPEDAAEIAAIWNPIIRNTLVTFTTEEKSEADLASLIAEKSASGQSFLVFEEARKVIGFATYGPFRGGPGYKHTAEHSVILAPSARGRGVGKALMTELERHAKRAEIHQMIAGISSANSQGIQFHKAIGYEQVATLPEVGRKFDQWLDLVLMQKRL